MSKISTFKEFNYSQFITETHNLVKDYMSYEEIEELVGENFFARIKGLFTNPIQKRKLDKLGQDLLKTKIELMKLEIEEDEVDLFKKQVNLLKRGSSDYEISNDNIETTDKAKAAKIKSLQDTESALVDQMDKIGSDSEKLQKYVDKIKFEIRIKANDATIKIADGEMARVLRDLKNQDLKTIRELDKELN